MAAPVVDDFDKALAGDERAQLRTMVTSLAVHMASLLIFIPANTYEQRELHRTTRELFESVVEYLKSNK